MFNCLMVLTGNGVVVVLVEQQWPGSSGLFRLAPPPPPTNQFLASHKMCLEFSNINMWILDEYDAFKGHPCLLDLGRFHRNITVPKTLEMVLEVLNRGILPKWSYFRNFSWTRHMIAFTQMIWDDALLWYTLDKKLTWINSIQSIHIYIYII